MGWDLDESAPAFLPFLVALHLGTALALVVYFRRDWWALLASLAPTRSDPASREQRRLFRLLVLGTLPAGLAGLLLEKRLPAVFGQFQTVAVLLILNGVLLSLGEWLRRRARPGELMTLAAWQAVAIGASQTLALLPGFSRSVATLVGGLLVGLSHQAAARFSFLLATPIIGAAALLKLPKLVQPSVREALGPALVGGLVAGVLAYVSTAVLMRYVKQQEVNALLPFGASCVLVGAATLLVGR